MAVIIVILVTSSLNHIHSSYNQARCYRDLFMHLLSRTFSSNLAYSSLLACFRKSSREMVSSENLVSRKWMQSSRAFTLLVSSSIWSERGSAGLTTSEKLLMYWLFWLASMNLFIFWFSERMV